MSAYKTLQRRLTHAGREYHFVTCEGQRANPSRGHPEVPPTWALMAAGKRWTVMPELADQDESEIDRQLLAWLGEHVGNEPGIVADRGDPASGRKA